jgi:hypothetical protein
MKTEDQVLALFAAENPIPSVDDLDLDLSDLSDHLDAFEQRSNEMIDIDSDTKAAEKPQRATRWLVAAVVVIVSAVGAVLLNGSPEPGSVAPATSQTTTPTTAATTPSTAATTNPQIDLVSIAVASIDAWNSGDFDAWLALLAPSADEDLIFSESLMIGGRRIQLTGNCAIRSQGPDGGGAVECPVSVDDAFNGAGNVTSSGIMTFLVGSDGLIGHTSDTLFTDENGDCCGEWEAFNEAFNTWLQDAYPDVFAVIGPQGSDPMWYLPGYASRNPDDMLIALQYVDEFVAQSDTYPLP